jgi:hypothetical protein
MSEAEVVDRALALATQALDELMAVVGEASRSTLDAALVNLSQQPGAHRTHDGRRRWVAAHLVQCVRYDLPPHGAIVDDA